MERLWCEELRKLFKQTSYDSPVCVPGQKILYGATRHEEVKVICEVDADPTDISFHWSFNKSGENMEDVPFVSDGTKSTATVTAKTDYDFGTLMCTGTNSVGMQREPCVYTVITAGPPDPVQNCTLMNITQHSFRLECMEGANGGLRQHFVMEVHDTALHRLRGNHTADIPFFLARDLPSATGFVVVVYAINAKGKSQAVVLRVNTAPSKQSDQRKGGRWQLTSQVMFVGLAAIFFVILLVIIAVVLIRKTRRRMHDQKRHMKRNCKTAEALLKNNKEGTPDMCIIVPEEDEKPSEISYQNPPEVITMTNPYIDDLYCHRDSKPPSPYLGEYEEEPVRRRENVLVRLQHSLTRRKRNGGDAGSDESCQMQTFGSPLDKKSVVSLPSSISPHQSTEMMIAEDPRKCDLIDSCPNEPYMPVR
ncbi:hypothetical protein JTE90_027748 [Oedothorax gibbosus]|uniref:Ig-like domain-containing protein n=1 Tax=Oedothorax gibbosus TaxID=931172 RepID=A0AAV6V906_9ARAC|nr:hypothetical protein JTE90_027748 [Oedothorax gibbosus]